MQISKSIRQLTLLGATLGLLTLPGITGRAETTTCPGAPAAKLVIGRDAITTVGVPNLRDKPSLSGKIYVQIPDKQTVSVLDGPVCADKYAWWKVDYQEQTGYIAEGDASQYYALPTTTAIQKFDLGTSDSVDVNYKGISFTYTGTFGPLVEADNVFAVKVDPDQMIIPAAPEFTEFRFRQEDSVPDFNIPTLSVYSVDAFKSANTDAAASFDSLAKVLKSKPKTLPDDFPVIPMINAGTAFHSNVSYLDFGSGSGVRYVTMYSSDVSEITPDRTVLVFSGLSSDGKTYVTATFPIAPDVLTSKPVAFPDLSGDNAGDLYTQYLSKVVANLNNSSSDQFKPALDDIDALLKSVTLSSAGQ